MKFLITALTLFVVTSAKAEMKPYGTMVPYLCAKNVQSKTDVQSVCLSRRTGMNGTWLQLWHHSGRVPANFPVSSIMPGNSGITGITNTVIVNVLTEGDIMVPLYGFGTPSKIKSLSGRVGPFEFRAANFETVMTTM